MYNGYYNAKNIHTSCPRLHSHYVSLFPIPISIYILVWCFDTPYYPYLCLAMNERICK